MRRVAAERFMRGEVDGQRWLPPSLVIIDWRNYFVAMLSVASSLSSVALLLVVVGGVCGEMSIGSYPLITAVDV
ncbi:hypothetical protein GPALN_014283 [Globodera pallida]|nr:hypothetical protein GPALN_014283 [Globodera pallida]